MSVYEALMVAIAFSTLNVTLIALIVAINTHKKIDTLRDKTGNVYFL